MYTVRMILVSSFTGQKIHLRANLLNAILTEHRVNNETRLANTIVILFTSDYKYLPHVIFNGSLFSPQMNVKFFNKFPYN